MQVSSTVQFAVNVVCNQTASLYVRFFFNNVNTSCMSLYFDADEYVYLQLCCTRCESAGQKYIRSIYPRLLVDEIKHLFLFNVTDDGIVFIRNVMRMTYNPAITTIRSRG